MQNDLFRVKKLVYDVIDLKISEIMDEPESSEYNACTFKLDNKYVKFRTAKITPTKIGQFVTIWKRNKLGITAPFDYSDALDFIIVCAKTDCQFGQFIFPKAILNEKDIISGKGKLGKRGIRVYPPWDRSENPQAKRTQMWQLNYFLDLSNENSVDLLKARMLYHID
jgi:hypothetical protein